MPIQLGHHTAGISDGFPHVLLIVVFMEALNPGSSAVGRMLRLVGLHVGVIIYFIFSFSVSRLRIKQGVISNAVSLS